MTASPIRGTHSGNIADVLHEELARIRSLIETTAASCTCRESLDEALERFEQCETTLLRSRLIEDAQRARSAIAALVGLLADLDETDEGERDTSVFGQFADLFESIAAEAGSGATSLRALAAGKDSA